MMSLKIGAVWANAETSKAATYKARIKNSFALEKEWLESIELSF